MKLRLLAFTLLIFTLTVKGQDPHFSLYSMSPVFMNPAESGNFDGTYRLCMNYRNQWNSITTPFLTFLGGIDLPVRRKRPGRDYWGAGLYLLRDKAGDGGYGITAASISGAYYHSLSYRSDHYLSLGFSLSPAENSIDFDRLQFPDQYDGTQYNPGILHGEQVGHEWVYYVDLNMGAMWSLNKTNGKKYSLGLSVFHLNQPNHSLLKNQSIPLLMRWNLTGNLSYPINNYWVIEPGFYYQRQDKHTEAVVGGIVRYLKYATPVNHTTLFGGVKTRWQDAIIVIAGMEYEELNFGLSYDINYSGLRKVSYLKGGMEIAIQYIFNKPKGVLKRDVTCPIF